MAASDETTHRHNQPPAGMNWLNLEIRMLRAPAYMGSNPTERATWLNVLAYCAQQENGGRIEDAALWKDRQWQQMCGVTRREVTRPSKLLTWDGQDLVVWAFPLQKQKEVQARRRVAVRNGKHGGRPRKPTPKPPSKPTLVSEQNRHSKAEGEGEREGEGEGEIEREGEIEIERKEDRTERTPSAREGLPQSSGDVKTEAARFPVTSTVPSKPDDGFCEWWFDEQEKCGWTDPRNGTPWHDWRAAFSAAWRSHFHRNRQRRSRTQPPDRSRAVQPRHDSADEEL